jgi:hypothetical protein
MARLGSEFAHQRGGKSWEHLESGGCMVLADTRGESECERARFIHFSRARLSVSPLKVLLQPEILMSRLF